MRSYSIDPSVFSDESWWHWAVTVPLLAASLAGVAWALPVAVALWAATGLYFACRVGGLKPFPAQVRVAYLGLLLIGALPWMQWVHWTQFAGTTAMVTVGYCPLIRLLSLSPPNREEPLTWSLVWRVFVTDPCAGGLVTWDGRSGDPPVGCRALGRDRAPRSCSLPGGVAAKAHR